MKMEKSAVALKKEISEAEARVADLKRRAEVKMSVAEEIREAEIAAATAEQKERLVYLRLDELTKRRKGLSAEAQTGMPDSGLVRAARSKVVDIDSEIAELARAQEVALAESASARATLASLQAARDATPEYATYIAKKRELTESFNRMSEDVTAAFSRAREVLSALEQLAGQEQVLLSSSHSNFVRLGLVCANSLNPASQLQRRCSELRSKFQRDLE
jgi:hypothetical protein